jgi:hypothetical protein
MMRPLRTSLCLAVSALLCCLNLSAGVSSERFAFKPGVTLQIGSVATEGIRVDSVRFDLPLAKGGRVSRTAGPATVTLAVSNTGNRARRLGVAVALFDEQGQLVGVASGGSRLASLKTGRQKHYKLIFEDVHGEIAKATVFQISVESKR